MYNRDNARNVATCPDERSMKKSDPTNQAQIKKKSTVLKTYLND